jgi:glycosyltransferase involved in cell wall biosynthesis
MSCETPFVSTKVGLVNELAQHGKEGFLVDRDPKAFAEYVTLLLDDYKLREKMGKRGRELVLKHCEWNDVVRMYAETYVRFLETLSMR